MKSFLLPILAITLAATGCASELETPSEENLTEAEAENLKVIVSAAQADVNEVRVVFPEGTKAPKSVTSYTSPKGPGLGGIDWFQKWPGGVNASHNWEAGTDFGKRCMVASTARFEAIMKDPPEELVAFLAQYSGWSGRFYNWVDDYSGKSPEGQGASGDASKPRLWAWRTTLTKWIAQTSKDGSCLLPTRDMVIEYVKVCQSRLSESTENPGRLEGEIQGASR